MCLLLVAYASELCSPGNVGLLLHRQSFHTEPAQQCTLNSSKILLTKVINNTHAQLQLTNAPDHSATHQSPAEPLGLWISHSHRLYYQRELLQASLS